jgi:hypothetical protein
MVILAELLSQEITVLTAPLAVDDYGNRVPDWAAATERTVAAYVRPAPASENVADRSAVEAQWQVHTNDLNVGALDRVVFDGETYEIDGQPLIWKVDPEGATGHAKFLLRKVAGG